MMQSFDQLDVPQLASAEFLIRWLLMIEQAVKRSPRTPTFEGLDHYITHALDEAGGVITSTFTKHIAEEQKSEATVLKQQRLHREERKADDARRRTLDTGDRPDKKNKKNKKGEKGKKGEAAAGGDDAGDTE